MCWRGSEGAGRGLPVIWITLYMWGQYVHWFKSVCVCQGLRWGLKWELHPLHTPPPPSVMPYKGGGGIGTFVTLLRDTLTGHTNTLDTRIPRSHTDCPQKRLCASGFSPSWGLWTENRGESWNTPSIISPARTRAKKDSPDFLEKYF